MATPIPAGDQEQHTTSEEDVQRLRGHGVIYRGDVRLLEADYELTIAPADPAGVAVGPPEQPRIARNITGRLLGSFYKAEAMEGVHTLRLEDGRAFDFRVLQPETNEIIGVSWFH